MKSMFLGRFQPFHQGHYNVVEKYKDEFEEFKLVVGSPNQSKTKDNPLSFQERKSIIKQCFPDVEVDKIEDEEKTDEGDKKWVSKLEGKDADALITGNKHVQELIEKHSNMNLEKPDMFEPEIYSGTEIRRRVRSGEEWRYLIPRCGQEKIEDLEDKIDDSGHDFNFKPGWKKKNAYHGTSEGN